MFHMAAAQAAVKLGAVKHSSLCKRIGHKKGGDVIDEVLLTSLYDMRTKARTPRSERLRALVFHTWSFDS